MAISLYSTYGPYGHIVVQHSPYGHTIIQRSPYGPIIVHYGPYGRIIVQYIMVHIVIMYSMVHRVISLYTMDHMIITLYTVVHKVISLSLDTQSTDDIDIRPWLNHEKQVSQKLANMENQKEWGPLGSERRWSITNQRQDRVRSNVVFKGLLTIALTKIHIHQNRHFLAHFHTSFIWKTHSIRFFQNIKDPFRRRWTMT